MAECEETKKRSRSQSRQTDKKESRKSRSMTRSSTPTMRNPLPKVDKDVITETIESLEHLNLDFHPLPKRQPAVSTPDLLEKIRAQQKECDEGTLKFLDHDNVKFDKDSCCFSLITTECVSKPQEDTVKAYRQALEIVAKMLKEGLWNTTRGMFYTGEDVQRTQKRSDIIIRHLTSKLEVDRPQLNVFPGDTGSVIGPLSYKLHNVMDVNCNLEHHLEVKPKRGVYVPDDIRTISDMDGLGIKFVLVVESLAVYAILATANFHNNYDCLLMTGRGQPDLCVREFSRFVSEGLKVPLFYLSDCDPNGIEIYTVYKYGSMNMAFDNKYLANKNIIWLGIWPSDLSKYGIPSVEMNDEDIKKVNQLVNKEFVRGDKKLKEEMGNMVSSKQKTSICMLNCESPHGVSDFVLLKLKQVVDEMLILKE